jgi:serine O-acetyltransferase
MTRPGTSLIGDLQADLQFILKYLNLPPTPRNIAWVVFTCDSFAITSLFRTRQWCRRRGIPGVSRAFRALETALFAIELGKDVELGQGVFFLHSVGTVVGGDAKIGAACVFLGNNTIGGEGGVAAPTIGAGTVIGAGARVLGEIEIGEDCVLGANAVVLEDIPAGKVAAGVPARVIGDAPPSRRHS